MTEQKQPQAGEWWLLDGDIAKCHGISQAGCPIMEMSDGEFIFTDCDWSDWHHEPSCTSFDWQPPAPIDPGEGWGLLPVGTVLQEGDEYLDFFGVWTETQQAGTAIGDTTMDHYRRRKPTAETWPKYYVRTSGADSWVYRADGRYTIRNLTCDCVAEPAEWYWRHGNMVEITESEALARVRPAEPIAADSIPDHRPARDVLMDVLEWLNPEDETSPTNVAAAVETIEQWLEDNPEPVEPIAHPVERTATPLVNAVVESPDDWVEITDPEHVLRFGIDQFKQLFPGDELWATVWKSAHMTPAQAGFIHGIHCRRRDLPALPAPQPKRTPVRLGIQKNGVVFAVSDPALLYDNKEMKHDADGFYVEEGE